MTREQFYEAEHIAVDGYPPAEPISEDASDSWWSTIAALAAMAAIAAVGWAGIHHNEQRIEAMEQGQ